MADAHTPEKEVERVCKGLGVDNPGELLRWLPKGYRDYRAPSDSIPKMFGHGKVALRVTILSKEEYDRQGSLTGIHSAQKPYRISMRVRDGRGYECYMTVFGAIQPWKAVSVGSAVTVYATVDEWNGKLQIKGPELIPEHRVGKICPMYRGKRRKVSAEAVEAAAEVALESHIQDAIESIERACGYSEAEICAETSLGIKSLGALLRALHSPASMAAAEEAVSQARNVSILMLKRMAARLSERPICERSRIEINREMLASLMGQLPYPLTKDQTTAVAEIIHDLESDKAMRRLLSGDVGTGKTLTFVIPAVAALMMGKSVAIVAPNQPLVNQLAEEVKQLYPNAPVHIVVGGNSKQALREGPCILLGTMALANVVKRSGREIDFLICDEQHKFSTEQREALVAEHTNLLEATATAIPRTVALMTHGGMSVSILRESPVQKTIKTRLAFPERREDVIGFLEQKVVNKGGQLAVIYPRLESSQGKKSGAIEAALHWEKRYPGKVSVLHGRLSEEEKRAVIDEFKRGDKRVLVATTIFELGLTVEGLRGLLVIDPDRLGASQLHQLRGRLARKGGVGYMIMYMRQPVDAYDPETVARLQRVEATTDGFELAEDDAYARGFGDLQDGEVQDGKMPVLFYGVSIRPDELVAD
ncbi:DEAD/DEAH box helicase [Azonexus hydrophilus]|uniref:DEAD/DEAH box helicase n=1 Tax=Azonexus hydrophilus TaxID=418702 RepID=A0ABZ2XMB7_9RHOO